MKRLNLIMIILWSLIGAAILAALIGMTFFNWRGVSVSGSALSEPDLVVNDSVGLEDISTIKLSFSADSCRLYLTDDENMTVRHYARGIPQERYVKVSRQNDELTVYTRDVIALSLAPWSLSVIEIYLPESYAEKLDIGIASGTLDIGDQGRPGTALELAELGVTISSGTFRSEYEIGAPIVNIGVTSGTVRLNAGLESENYTIKTSSGTINVAEKLIGSGNVNVTSGTVRLSGVDIAEFLNVKANSGTINIGVAGNPGLQFTGRKNSGTISTYFGKFNDGQTFSATVGEAPYKSLDVQVTSGTIRVTQE